ncbi:MAG: hypothetical protein PHU46_12190 [Rhodocyclaceae bacterium]|nr:hypothetical protein [Rhodocyclaceae bacterium]
MSRLIRNTAILAKIETTYGTDAAPAGATEAILASNFTATPLAANYVDRGLVRPFLGTSDRLIGYTYKDLAFDVEVAGSGTAGSAPAWGKLLRACAFAETITAGQRVDYNPISTAFESLTIYYYDDGVLHKLLGARGTVEFKLPVGQKPVMAFKFTGLDGGDAAAANPSLTLTAWQPPVAVTNANTGQLTLGCTYAAGALSGGATYASQGLTANLAGKVVYQELVGSSQVDFTDRDPSGKLVLDLTAAQEVALYTTVKSMTKQGLGMTQGTVAGNKFLFFAPGAQLMNPSKQDMNGRRLIGFDIDFTPVAGNDEMRIVAL